MRVKHHGAQFGVTGSCHELVLETGSILVDCGLYQGEDRVYEIEQDALSISNIAALVVTHVHIDHVGRIPWLLQAGFRGPIYLTKASARLLPEVLNDAMNFIPSIEDALRDVLLKRLVHQLKPCRYDHPYRLVVGAEVVELNFRVAGHILGSAFVEVNTKGRTITFSGDLGCKGTPLLPDVAKPNATDYLLIETTYGDRVHETRKNRQAKLRRLIEKTLANKGTTIIPAFSIGRTQELIYEFEAIFNESWGEEWERLPIIVDSPLAARFTRIYQEYKADWDREAKVKVQEGRRPLSFSNLIVIDSYVDHVALVNRLKQRGESAIVIAASGMCEGGRVVDFLEALLPDPRTDVLFVGYQARNTLGDRLQRCQTERIEINGELVEMNANIERLGGYSAHADRDELLAFISSFDQPPSAIRLIHGELSAQRAFAERLRSTYPSIQVSLACDGRDLFIE